MTTATLWDNEVSYWMAIVLGAVVLVVGIWSIIFGVMCTAKLTKIRNKGLIPNFETINRSVFGQWIRENCGDVRLSGEELEHVFDAISGDKVVVSAQDIAALNEDDYLAMV